MVAPGIADRLKRSVVVENCAGANGEIAAASVAKAPPDGDVFMLASNGSTTVAPALNPNLSYDVRIDFAAVAPVGINPMLLVVRPDLPARNVTESLAMARERPGKLNGASAGAGGATHLALELFKSLGRVDIVHVPYKGGGPAMADLMASLVDIYFGGLSTALPHVKAGKLRALGQTSARRARPAAPDIPTIAELGLPGYEAAISYWHPPACWHGAPAGRSPCTRPSTRRSARPRSRRSSSRSAPIRNSARPPSSRPMSPPTTPNGPASPRKRASRRSDRHGGCHCGWTQQPHAEEATTKWPSRSMGDIMTEAHPSRQRSSGPLPQGKVFTWRLPRYFTDENAVGARNWLETLATMAPSFSVSARSACHSGSAAKAFHFFSRSASESDSSR